MIARYAIIQSTHINISFKGITSMMISASQFDEQVGYQRAAARYGEPLVCELQYQVSKDTCDYWRRVRRKRRAEVVMVVRTLDGRFVIHTKSFYPSGIYRLMTGGIKLGEDLEAAARREALEEIGHDVTIERFLAVQHHTFVCGQECLSFTSYLFLMLAEDRPLQATDTTEDIADYRTVPLVGLIQVADQLERLPPDWIDWGRFRASAHRLAVETLTMQAV